MRRINRPDTCKISFLPDWEVAQVLLTPPKRFTVYCRSGMDVRPTYQYLAAQLQIHGTKTTLLPHFLPTPDIWIRDWAPIATRDGSLMTFLYAPSYVPKKELDHTACHISRQWIAKRMDAALLPIPLKLEGGNLVHNGENIIIMTRSVLDQNPHLTPSTLTRLFAEWGQKLVMLPPEPGDVISHADGLCRFIDPQTLLVNDYPSSMSSYSRTLDKHLKAQIPGIRRIQLPWFCESEIFNGIPSARGNYMNFLHTRSVLVVPSYGHPKDQTAFNLLQELLPMKTVISIPAHELALHGGVFNCVSMGYRDVSAP